MYAILQIVAQGCKPSGARPLTQGNQTAGSVPLQLGGDSGMALLGSTRPTDSQNRRMDDIFCCSLPPEDPFFGYLPADSDNANKFDSLLIRKIAWLSPFHIFGFSVFGVSAIPLSTSVNSMLALCISARGVASRVAHRQIESFFGSRQWPNLGTSMAQSVSHSRCRKRHRDSGGLLPAIDEDPYWSLREGV